jgi:hypothetical protein
MAGVIDQAMAEADEDRRRQFDRDHGKETFEAWARGWVEAKRRAKDREDQEDRELRWYRTNWNR